MRVLHTATAAAPTPQTALYYLRVIVYSLASLLALSLLCVGTVAVIAELKGTWHWAIHLESTISYMGIIVAALLVPLIPATGLLFAGRWWFDA